MIKKLFLIIFLMCTPLKSFDLPNLSAQEFIAGTVFGPAAVCALYAFIIHPFFNNNQKQPKASTTLVLGAVGSYGMVAALFLQKHFNANISEEFLAGAGISAALFAYWINYKIIVLENHSYEPTSFVCKSVYY